MDKIYVPLGDEIFEIPIPVKDRYVFLKDIASLLVDKNNKPLSSEKLKMKLAKLDVKVSEKIPLNTFLLEVFPALAYLDSDVGVSNPKIIHLIAKYALYHAYYITQTISEEHFNQAKKKLGKMLFVELPEAFKRTPNGIEVVDNKLVEVYILDSGIPVYRFIPEGKDKTNF